MTNLPNETIQLAGAFIEGYMSGVSKQSQDRLSMTLDSIAQKLRKGANIESALSMARTYGHVLTNKFPLPIDKVIAGVEAIDALLTFFPKKETPDA